MNVPFTSTVLNMSIKNVDAIKELEPKQLLDLHNELANATVKRFADKKSGLERTIKAFTTWQLQQTVKAPKVVDPTEHKSFRVDSNRGKIIAAASKAGGATRPQLRELTGWEDADLTAALARIESYNGLTVTKTGEGDEQVIVVTGLLRTRKAFAFDPGKEIREHKPNTKRAKVVELLATKEGATFDQVKEVTGWDDRTAYEGIRLLNSYLGYGLKETGEGRIIAYRKAG